MTWVTWLARYVPDVRISWPENMVRWHKERACRFIFKRIKPAIAIRRRSTAIIWVDIKYSMRALICDVSCRAWPAKLWNGSYSVIDVDSLFLRQFDQTSNKTHSYNYHFSESSSMLIFLWLMRSGIRSHIEYLIPAIREIFNTQILLINL